MSHDINPFDDELTPDDYSDLDRATDWTLFSDAIEEARRDGRAMIEDSEHLAAVLDQMVPHLFAAEIYQKSGLLVNVRRPQGELPALVAGTPEAVLDELSRHTCLYVERRVKGETQRRLLRTPVLYARTILSRGTWAPHHIRPIRAIVEWPVRRPDGTISTATGYDADMRILREGAELELPARVTRDEALSAVDRLLSLFSEFPFADPAHPSSWLAYALTIVCRLSISGNVPAWVFTATQQGSGKSLLAQAAAALVTGRPIVTAGFPEDETEMAKVMFARLLSGSPLMLLDNITRKIESATLDAVITSGGWFEGRILGQSATQRTAVETVICLTANNPEISRDLLRRMLEVRLEPMVEAHASLEHSIPDLLGHIAEHRDELLRDLLSILIAYQTAGSPSVNLPPMGSFEAWSSVVRAPLVWLGMPDPLETQSMLRERCDVDGETRGEFFGLWWRVYGEEPVTTGQVMEDLRESAANQDVGYSQRAKALRELEMMTRSWDRRGNLPQSPVTLGRRLSRLEGVGAGLRLTRARRDHGRTRVWVMAQVGQTAAV